MLAVNRCSVWPMENHLLCGVDFPIDCHNRRNCFICTIVSASLCLGLVSNPIRRCTFPTNFSLLLSTKIPRKSIICINWIINFKYHEYRSQISDPFWTILLTVATYQFVTTVWAMIMYLKMNTVQRPDGQEVTDKMNQNNIRLVGLSIGNILIKYSWNLRDDNRYFFMPLPIKGIPLSLSGVQSLIEEFSTGSPFVSWLFQLNSVSGIFFCLVYCTLLIAILFLYVISTRETDISSEKFNAFTQEVPNVTGTRYSYINVARNRLAFN